ncbi:hypothetical protein ACLMJK_000807 [Lecanora helva]
MHYTNPRSRMTSPLGISSWGSIKSAGTRLMADCLKTGSSSGGEMAVKDKTSEDPVLIIYMWASGASFETKLNRYEDDPTYSVQLAQGTFNGTNPNGTNNSHIDEAAASKASPRAETGSSVPLIVGGGLNNSQVNSF